MEQTAVALFAGVGATMKGQRDIIGANVIGIERDSVAVETLRRNFRREQVLQEDIKTFDFARLGKADIVLGGPPCQPFSQATDGSGEYDERDCIPDFIRAVAQLEPKVFVMEEVPTLTWAKHRPYLDRVVKDLESVGYNVAWRVLDMSKYGVPQARKRLFVVGVRADHADEVRWPHERKAPTMAEALGWDEGEVYLRNQFAPEPARVDRQDPRLRWPLERPSTTVVGSFRPDVQAAPGYRKAGDGPRQNTPGSVVITFEEALRLQGLPADWQVAGTESQRRLQVGNSCPPAMTALIVGANL